MSTTGDNLIAVHLNDGVGRIAQERKRQIAEEGWTPGHDAAHKYGEMIDAAQAYLTSANYQDGTGGAWWPWDRSLFKPGAPIRDLERAGALIAAEIDRRLAAGETA